MDKSPKRSPKPKQKKQAEKEVTKSGIFDKELQPGKTDNNRKVRKGQPKML